MGVAMGPSSARVNYTEKWTDRIADDVQKFSPIVESFTAINGFPFGQYGSLMFVKLQNWSDRNVTAEQLTFKILPDILKVQGVKAMLMSPSALPVSKGIYNFQFVVKTMGSYADLNKVTEKITTAANANPSVISTQVDLKIDQPNLTVEINKIKANYYGVSMSEIASTLSNAFGQPQFNEFTLNGYSYYAIPQIEDSMRGNKDIIDVLNVTSSTTGKQFPLSTFITFKDTISSNSWPHFQSQRSATISAQLGSGYSSQQGLDYFKGLFDEYKTSDMSWDTTGETRSFLQTQGSMGVLFIGALIVIFLVLAALYESFIDPLIVMFTVPLAIASALVASYVVGDSLNVYTELGLITLIGLITKHGILLVDFANMHQKEHNSTPLEAIIEAAVIRLKPVLMTTLAMVLGAVPLLMASGAGSNARK